MTERKRHILVAGAGSWGTALAVLLSSNEHQVYLWGREQAQQLRLAEERENRQYLPGISFPPNLHPVTEDLPAVLAQIDELLIVVPSDGFRATLTTLAPQLRPETRVCWATKGLEHGSGQLLHQVAEEILGNQRPMAVISGPSFAMEVAKGLPTAMTVAANNETYAEELAALLHNSACRMYTSADMIGVQVGGASKNVIAIAAGIADGLGFGANTRAALITRGLTEIMRLGVALGGRSETFMGLAGMGDLVLTCTDNQSRNRRFGYALSQGKGIEQARQDIGQVVEGAFAAAQIVQLAQRLDIEMPISQQVLAVLQGQCTPEQAVENLLGREPKQEIA